MTLLRREPPPCYVGKQARRIPALELGSELLNIGTVRAKAIVANELPLSSKLVMNNCVETRTRGNVLRQAQGMLGDKR